MGEECQSTSKRLRQADILADEENTSSNSLSSSGAPLINRCVVRDTLSSY